MRLYDGLIVFSVFSAVHSIFYMSRRFSSQAIGFNAREDNDQAPEYAIQQRTARSVCAE